MQIPTLKTRRLAVDKGIKYSMTDEKVMDILKEAKVIKSQRDIFIVWFRAFEKKDFGR